MSIGVADPTPGRIQVVWATIARLTRSWGVWIGCGFVGCMFATAITGPIPSSANWQGSIICGGNGEQFTHLKYTYIEEGQTSADGSVSSPGPAEGFSYHCLDTHTHRLSGSKTAIVLFLQFIAGTLVTYLLTLVLSSRSALKRRHDALAEPAGANAPVSAS